MADKIDIENVAKLASLKLNEEEKQQLEKDLSMIIDHFAETANAAQHGYDGPLRCVLKRKDSWE